MTKLIFILFSSIIFCSCDSISGSGNIKTETRNVEHFEGIKSSSSLDIEVTNDEQQSVKIEADDNILPFIIASVEDGMLDVRYKPNTSFSNTHVKVLVSASMLKSLIIGGSGSITAKNTLKADKMEIKIIGSGDIDAAIDAPSITADISGSGSIKLEGKSKDFNCSISGSGDLDCKNLLSENTTATINGSGTAHVFASVHLNANVSGSGDIYYSGNPSSPQTHTSGSGSVQPEK